MSLPRSIPSLLLVYSLGFSGGVPPIRPQRALDWDLVPKAFARHLPDGYSIDSALRGTADLNGDKSPDTFFVIRHGDGVSAGIAWLSNNQLNHGWVETPAAATIRDLSSVRGEVVTRAVVHDADDLPCCPTHELRIHYALVNGQLREVGRVDEPVDIKTNSGGVSPRAHKVEPPSSAPFAVDGVVTAPNTADLLVTVPPRHRLNATLESAFDDVALEALGPAGVGLTAEKLRRNYGVDVHGAEEHLIRVRPLGGGNIRYRVTLQVVPLDQVPTVYLTFDDGPDPRYTPAILDILDSVGAKATFFWIGQSMRRHPELVANAVSRGHRVGNHTFSHQSIAGGNGEQIALGRAAVNELAGAGATRCLRPPYAKVTQTTHAVAASMGEIVTMWTIDTRDWTKPGVGTIVSRALAGVRPGSVILFHDGGGERSQTIEALRRIVPELVGRGFRLTALTCD